MKKTILLFVFALVCMTAFGQIRVGLGLLGGAPGGNFGDLYDFGVGGYIEPKYSATKSLEVGVHLAWMAFAGGDVSGTSASISAAKVVPILVVGQYYLTNIGPKVYAGFGVGPYRVDFGSLDAGTSGGSIEDIGSETKFGFAPKVGVNFGGFDLGIAYHIVNDLNFLGFNLGFHFGKRR